MPPKFGTSGLRGLVMELTDPLVEAYVQAFAQSCPVGGQVFVGRDLRSSSPRIAAAVLRAGQAAGLQVVDCGEVPTPALALAAKAAGAGAVMITGSHIPDDRNGLKFYTTAGEITKQDEAAISRAYEGGLPSDPAKPGPEPISGQESDVLQAFHARYVTAFGARALQGLHIGVYEHSTVARDVMAQTLKALGAKVTSLGRSDVFIPVDTEAVAPDTQAQMSAWTREGTFDAIVSADGDGDRPLVANADGVVVPGDLLGLLTAQFCKATSVVVPVSCNTALEMSGAFGRVLRTQIGSPHVIAGIEAVLAENEKEIVVGFEANGGLLLGSDVSGLVGEGLSPLMTRDSILPILAPLACVKETGKSLAVLIEELPDRFTAADRLQDVDLDRVRSLMKRLRGSQQDRQTFFGRPETALDETDGLRLTFADGSIVHLRPSGNAPELRCYAEADSPERAAELVRDGLSRLKKALV